MLHAVIAELAQEKHWLAGVLGQHVFESTCKMSAGSEYQ
jgi:hypothetical protein